MFLMHKDLVIKSYTVQLGFAPTGHKRKKGDGRTPEGVYRITHRNPNSAFHLSLGVSYPNANDVKTAQKRGWNPGGDIFIHGRGENGRPGKDWTAGCIAVEDWEMEEIWQKVRPGTRIKIVA
jgi:murein L,D-transpeptidase YafK